MTNKDELILDYDFKVYKVPKNDTYYMIDEDGNKFILELVAKLQYDVLHDVCVDTDNLSILFENDVCGECVDDDGIYYYWFKQV